MKQSVTGPILRKGLRKLLMKIKDKMKV